MKRFLFMILLLSVFCTAQIKIDYGYYSTHSDTMLDTTQVWANDSGCFLSSIYMYNMSVDSAAFVHFYDSADSALVGTDEAKLWFGIPKGESLFIQFYGMGVPFTSGIQYAATKFYDSRINPDSTVIINISYYDMWR